MILPVKRLAVITLITLHTLVLMWSTVDRTYTWAAKQSEALSAASSSSCVEHSAAVGKQRPANPICKSHRRIIQNPFVVEPPVFASWIALSNEAPHQASNALVARPDSRQLSGRAPPRFV